MPVADNRRPAVVVSAIASGLIAVWYFIGQGGPSPAIMGNTNKPKWKLETVPGFFWQDEPGTSEEFDYQKHNFGLIERAYDTDGGAETTWTQWQRFEHYVNELIKSSNSDTSYKIIYQGRHGEGYHNVGEAKYGTKAWNEHWSKLDGDGTLFWFDAHLTDKGKLQALHNNAFLKQQFEEAKMPAPEKYFASPLYRCLQTANLTYSDLELPTDKPFKPVIKELLRETMGEHTCDKRSTKSVIHDAFPAFAIEAGFEEQDELWQAGHRETFAEQDARTQKVLEDIFEHDQYTFVSFTSHSGAEASLLRVIGHREFRLPTGGMMPIFVKATGIN